jgi:SM-20-related protein
MPLQYAELPDCIDPSQQLLLLDQLRAQGWSQQTLFLPSELTMALEAECLCARDSGAMHSASTGRGQEKAVRADVRSDRIAWLEEGASVAGDRYLRIMESLRRILNREHFFGLQEYESHFAIYQPGDSYTRHLDRFGSEDSRVISVVIYLNENWLSEQGGALRLHPHGMPYEDIQPTASRLVIFLSADMPHEVMPATRERLSLAGWFKQRALG